MDQLRAMPTPTRAALEDAARKHFARLNADLDRPRPLDPVHRDQEIAVAVEASQARVRDLEDQLRQNVFDRAVQIAAAVLAELSGSDIQGFTERQSVVAGQLAARAEREQHRRLIHLLLTPAEPFTGDALFGVPPDRRTAPDAAPLATLPRPSLKPNEALKPLSEFYLRKKLLKGIGPSQHTELTRALGWMCEALGGDRDIHDVPKDILRDLRDALCRLDATLGSVGAPFEDRLTNVRENQIKSVTAKRYWTSIQAFFAWAVDEGYIDDSPASGLRVEARKDEVTRTPRPFTPEEVKRLLGTPLYAGCQSPKRVFAPGTCLSKQDHWWSGVLALYTGMRAGELSQLEPSNFHFDAEAPFVAITTVDESGNATKKAKTRSSVRDIPLHPVLVELGLRAFVELRAKRYPGKRTFFGFRLGSTGRTSEGMTAFWGRYLRAMGLWEEGRATHMFRHTVADRLRASGVTDEDIGAILGHGGRTITAGYGGVQPLARKSGTIAMIDYGFDVVALLRENEARLKAKPADALGDHVSDCDVSVV